MNVPWDLTGPPNRDPAAGVISVKTVWAISDLPAPLFGWTLKRKSSWFYWPTASTPPVKTKRSRIFVHESMMLSWNLSSSHLSIIWPLAMIYASHVICASRDTWLSAVINSRYQPKAISYKKWQRSDWHEMNDAKQMTICEYQSRSNVIKSFRWKLNSSLKLVAKLRFAIARYAKLLL